MSFSAAYLGAVLDAHAPAGATGLVVALSGGADSAGLLIAASRSRAPAFAACGLRAVHVDHGLQAAAASFREACAALCAALDIPLTVISVERPNAAGRVDRGGGARRALRGARRGAAGPANVC